MPALDSTTSILIGGIECWDEETEEEFGRDSSQITRIIVCRWSDRLALVLALLGKVVTTGDPPISVVTPPLVYPDVPWMYAKNVSIKGVAGEDGMSVGANGVVAFPWARLTVSYGPVEPGTLDSIEVGEEDLDFSSEVITFASDQPSFQWSSDGKYLPPEFPVTQIVPCIAFTKTKKGLKSLPVQALIAVAKAPLNNATYLGAPTGTMRFVGARSSHQISIGGDKSYSLTVSFSFRPIEWNKLFRPDTGQFEAVTAVSSGKPIYDSSNFNTLNLT